MIVIACVRTVLYMGVMAEEWYSMPRWYIHTVHVHVHICMIMQIKDRC